MQSATAGAISRTPDHSEEMDITIAYDRYNYDAEKRRAMEFSAGSLTAVL